MESAVNAWRVARFVLYSPPLTLFVAYVRLFKDRSFFGSRGKRRSARSGLRLNAPTGLARSANGAPHETAPSRKRMTTRYSSCLRHRVLFLRARPHPTFAIFQVRAVHKHWLPVTCTNAHTHFPRLPNQTLCSARSARKPCPRRRSTYTSTAGANATFSPLLPETRQHPPHLPRAPQSPKANISTNKSRSGINCSARARYQGIHQGQKTRIGERERRGTSPSRHANVLAH